MIKKVIKIEEFYKKNYNYIENIKKNFVILPRKPISRSPIKSLQV